MDSPLRGCDQPIAWSLPSFASLIHNRVQIAFVFAFRQNNATITIIIDHNNFDLRRLSVRTTSEHSDHGPRAMNSASCW